MSLIVMKFGGSSVANTEKIMRVAGIIADAYKEGNSVAVVVSAQGDTTDDLIDKAGQIDQRPSAREMDMLLATGEQASAALMAMAINKLGVSAISLTGWQSGMLTDKNHSMARIRRIEGDRLLQEISNKNVVVVTGFQGYSKNDDITTLGRGGSDTSAVALAVALRADVCKIYTDVDGVYTADPRKVKTAVKLKEISYDEMLELATQGAQVLHNRSVELAKKYHVNLEVLSSLTNMPGTIIKESTNMEGLLVKGVAQDTNIAAVSVIGVPDQPGVAFKFISLLAQKNIHTDIIIQSEGRDGTQDISATVPLNMVDEAVELLKDSSGLNAKEVKVMKDVAKVSIVGSGIQTNVGVAARMFGALSEAKINISMISTSEIKISVIIAKKDVERAVNAIHDEFIL